MFSKSKQVFSKIEKSRVMQKDEFFKFAKLFEEELKLLFEECNIDDFEIKIGHFLVYGWFLVGEQRFHFDILDVRWTEFGLISVKKPCSTVYVNDVFSINDPQKGLKKIIGKYAQN